MSRNAFDQIERDAIRDDELRDIGKVERASENEGFESEDYRAWDKMKQEKRAKNRSDSAQMLRDAGVQFSEKNDGAHLIVTGHNGHIFDFWPGTGLWRMRGSTQQHRGVLSLIKMVCEQETANQLAG